LVNPHGDVFATIPDVAAALASQLSGAQDFDEYGNVIGGGRSNYGWVGGFSRTSAVVTGLVQLGVRLFNPVTGAFLAVDPVFGGNATPYGYPVSPIDSYDLNGRWSISIFSPAWWQVGWYGGLTRRVVIHLTWREAGQWAKWIKNRATSSMTAWIALGIGSYLAGAVTAALIGAAGSVYYYLKLAYWWHRPVTIYEDWYFWGGPWVYSFLW
jgi:RHS repeat-associated protein